MAKNPPITIAGVEILPGEQKTIEIPLVSMVTHQDLEMTAHVIHGSRPGPTLFISAAIHGDEINGVEIIRRLLKVKQIQRLSGTLIAIPIVNVHGFLSHSRYLPDGRDLNRSFPGSEKGSLAGRMANTFLREVVLKCTHGIDLHTGARHRENLPQIRADLSGEETKELAIAFGVPAIIDSKIRDGSLRETGGDKGIPILLYESGEALRFDEFAIRAGVRGIQRVMHKLNMLPKKRRTGTSAEVKKVVTPVISSNTSWVRAPGSGVLRVLVPLGAKTTKGSILGVIADPLGHNEVNVVAPGDGIVIGRTNLPLNHEGDALFHIAYYQRKVDEVHSQLETLQDKLSADDASPDPADVVEDGPIQ